MPRFPHEVIEQLRSEGYEATDAKIRHARETGWLKPMPRKVALGRGVHIYTKRHLDQLRRYLTEVSPGPRPMIPRPPRYVDPTVAERRASLDEGIRMLEEIQANILSPLPNEDMDTSLGKNVSLLVCEDLPDDGQC